MEYFHNSTRLESKAAAVALITEGEEITVYHDGKNYGYSIYRTAFDKYVATCLDCRRQFKKDTPEAAIRSGNAHKCLRRTHTRK